MGVGRPLFVTRVGSSVVRSIRASLSGQPSLGSRARRWGSLATGLRRVFPPKLWKLNWIQPPAKLLRISAGTVISLPVSGSIRRQRSLAASRAVGVMFSTSGRTFLGGILEPKRVLAAPICGLLLSETYIPSAE